MTGCASWSCGEDSVSELGKDRGTEGSGGDGAASARTAGAGRETRTGTVMRISYWGDTAKGTDSSILGRVCVFDLWRFWFTESSHSLSGFLL